VQLSADGVVVVHHDFRMSPGYARHEGVWLESPGPCIKDMTLQEMRSYDVGRARPGSDYAASHPDQVAVDGERIPTLAEVLALAKSATDFRLMVELKCDTHRDSGDPVALASAVRSLVQEADFISRTIFVGFDWRALAWLKEHQPDAEVWCTTSEKIAVSPDLLNIIKGMGGSGWFPHYSKLTDASAAMARKYNFRLASWTANEEAEMRRLMALGVDAICTDRPDILRDL